jgi:hypothetical protein
MTVIAYETVARFSRVQPPTYEKQDTPLSPWAHWSAVATALSEFGGVLRGEIDPDLVAATTQVAASRADWETVDRFAEAVNLNETVHRLRVEQEDASLAETLIGSPLQKGRLAAAASFCTRALRRAHLIPALKLSDVEQNRQRQRHMIEEHLRTPAPELADADQRFVAAAALACQAELAPIPDLRVNAADVLFTAYGDALAATTAQQPLLQ